MVRGTGIRVQTVVIAARGWGLALDEVAAEYNLTESQVDQALGFYDAHRAEIDTAIAAEQKLEAQYA